MIKSAFRHGFDRDLRRKALEDPALGPRVLAERPGFDGLDPVQLVAAARTARAAGPIGAKLALWLSGGLLDLGFRDEAQGVLEDDRIDYADRAAMQRLALAQAFAAAGEMKAARSALAAAHESGLPAPALHLAEPLDRVLASEPPRAADVAALAGELCALNLPELAADVLTPHLARPDKPRLVAAFNVLRLVGPDAAVRVLEALTPHYQLHGREASLRATLAVLEGGPDAGVEAESEDSSPRRLLLRACLAEACAAAQNWPAAIRRFDYAGKKWREPPDSLCELARCVGHDLLDLRPARLLAPDGPPRIYDLFPYNGEAAMLQLKLREMAGWIERFVLVEADETFPGRPKPLHFQADPEAAAGRHVGQIVPVVASKPPPHIDFTWAREFFQKDCSVLGLEGLARPDDFVILSDADEILDRAAVQAYGGELASGALRTFRYFLNCEVVSELPILKATVTRARYAAVFGWNYLRLGAIRYRRIDHLKGAGWHFSSIGDPAWLAYKMQCTAHEEWSYMDQSFFEQMLPKMKQEGGLGDQFVRREIDDSFPASIRDSREALADFIL